MKLKLMDNYMNSVARITRPFDTLLKGKLDWHRHSKKTLAIPKRGSYVEYVLQGRYVIKQGLMVITSAYASHADDIDEAGASITNIDIGESYTITNGVYELPKCAQRSDWPHHLNDIAEVIPQLKEIQITLPESWLVEAHSILVASQSATKSAQALSISREYFQRCFTKAYGMTPGQALREHKLKMALKALCTKRELIDIACSVGFADQSHMTRLVRSATNLSPKQFQLGHVTSVQD
jgi:AraC-like DNA-binding protein